MISEIFLIGIINGEKTGGKEMIAVVRVRGTVNVGKGIRRTLELLRLFRPNHLVIVGGENVSLKMVEKAKDYVTFGEIDVKTLALLLEKRGRAEGDKKLGDEFLKENKAKDFQEIAEKIIEGKIAVKELGIKPVFRLHPPRKGHERLGIKKPFKSGGALGFRGSEINGLIKSMM